MKERLTHTLAAQELDEGDQMRGCVDGQNAQACCLVESPAGFGWHQATGVERCCQAVSRCALCPRCQRDKEDGIDVGVADTERERERERRWKGGGWGGGRA